MAHSIAGFRINGIMGNHRWMLRRVREVWRPGLRVLELGAGDGGLGVRLSRVIPPACIEALDLAPFPPVIEPSRLRMTSACSPKVDPRAKGEEKAAGAARWPS